MSQCPRCGAILPETPQSFCPNCGTPLAAPPPLPVAAPPLTGAPSSTPPAGPGGPASPPGQGTPWERRAELGFVPALAETTKQVLFDAVEFYRRMPVDAGIGAPLGYAVIVGYLGLVVAAIYQAVLRIVMGHAVYELGARGPLGRVAPFLEGGAGFVFQVIFGPIFLVLGLFLGAGIYHLMLLLLGGARRGFEATFRVVCYGQAASVLLVVPFCGNLVAPLWAIVVMILGLAEAHGIGRGTAAAAVLLPILLMCCCCGLGFALFFGGLAAALGHAR